MDTKSWDDATVCGALLLLWKEKAFCRGKGSLDTLLLRSLAKKYVSTRILSARQIAAVRAKIGTFDWFFVGREIPKMQDLGVILGSDSPFSFALHNRTHFRVSLPKKSAKHKYVRQLSGITYRKDLGYYVCDATKRNGYVLLNNEFKPDHRAELWMQQPSDPLQDRDLDGLLLQPKPYQITGISYLLEKNGRAILADEMGLGKTGQAIAWAYFAKIRKICVCCPASLKVGWEREIALWTGERDTYIIFGKAITPEAVREIHAHKWVIINHDLLSAWSSVLAAASFEAYLLDEAHAFKNEDTSRTRTIQSLVKSTPHVIAISGTPFENRPIELYPILTMVDPALFPSKTRYAASFCGYDPTHPPSMHNTMQGATNTAKLNKILVETCMIRRKKADVLSELPEKTRIAIPVHLQEAQLAEYRSAEVDFRSWMKTHRSTSKMKSRKAEAIVKINVLKQLAAKAKLPAVFDWIDTYLANESKLVVFATHHEVIAALRHHYAKCCVVIDGTVPTEARQGLCDSFQNDPTIKLFIGNLRAAGTGLTLTAAKDTLTVELGWTSTIHDQAEDRVHRVGQRNAVSAYYLLAEGTIEMRIASLIDAKRGVVRQIMDGEDVADEELLDSLLREFDRSDLKS